MERKSTAKRIIALAAAAVVITAAVLGVLFRDKIYERFFAPDKPLKITSSPVDITVESGYAAVFSVIAEGRGLTFSWEYTTPNGSSGKLKGSVSDTLSLVTDISMNGNVYRCTVTDRNGVSQTSSDARLTVSREHTFGKMLVTKENTCLSDGEATYICSSCGAKKTEILPASGHDFNERVPYTGKRLFVCRVCSYSFETDAADKSALDEALAKIPQYVTVYYSGTSAKTLASIRDKLDSAVYGVKNYDLLSQKETEEYAKKINSALKNLSVRTTDGKNIYITTEKNGGAFLSAADGRKVLFDNSDVHLSEASFYGETKKPPYFLELPSGKTLFSAGNDRLLLQSAAEDPTLMRTPLVYNCADRLGISEAPSYDLAEMYVDGEYLGVYVVRSSPPEKAANEEKIKNELLELLSDDVKYDDIKNRIDTKRFARFVLLYCITGMSDSVNVDSLLYESDGKISIHIPYQCDGILRPDVRTDFTSELDKSAVLSKLVRNGDFMKEVAYAYTISSSRLENLCVPEDLAEETNEPKEPSAEKKTTESKTDGQSDSNETNESPTADNAEKTAGLSSFARLKKRYGGIIERNFAEGAVTYSDSFGRITRYPTFDENARALARTLRERLTAAAAFFGG